MTTEVNEVVLAVAHALAVAYAEEVERVVIAPQAHQFSQPASIPALCIRAKAEPNPDQSTGKIWQKLTIGTWRRIGGEFAHDALDLTHGGSRFLVKSSLMHQADGDLVHLFPEGPQVIYQTGAGVELVLEDYRAHFVPHGLIMDERRARRAARNAA